MNKKNSYRLIFYLILIPQIGNTKYVLHKQCKHKNYTWGDDTKHILYGWCKHINYTGNNKYKL